MQWGRLYAEIVDDYKVQQLNDKQFRFWINCLALTIANNGVLPPLEEVSFKLRISCNKCAYCVTSQSRHSDVTTLSQERHNAVTCDKCVTLINQLLAYGLLVEDPILRPHNWDKRQFRNDTSAERTKAYRERLKQKELILKASKCDVTSDVTVTPSEYRVQSTYIKTPLPPFSKGETKNIEIEKIVPRGVGEGDQNPIKKMTRAETLRSVTEEEGGAIQQIFDHWKKLAGHPTCHLESKRTLAILNGLRLGYTVEQCLDAVDGCFKTPHNMGDNKQGANFDRLGIIFRDADHIENFIRNKKNPPVGEGGQKKIKMKERKFSREAEKAEMSLLNFLTKFTNSHSAIFDDEKIHAAIDAIGGWASVKFPAQDDEKFFTDFKGEYDDLKEGWLSKYSPVLISSSDGINGILVKVLNGDFEVVLEDLKKSEIEQAENRKKNLVLEGQKKWAEDFEKRYGKKPVMKL